MNNHIVQHLIKYINKQQNFVDEYDDYDDPIYDDGMCSAFCDGEACLFHGIGENIQCPAAYEEECEEILSTKLEDISWCSRHSIKLAFILGIKPKDILNFVVEDEESEGNGCVLCKACCDDMTLLKAMKFLKSNTMETE